MSVQNLPVLVGVAPDGLVCGSTEAEAELTAWSVVWWLTTGGSGLRKGKRGSPRLPVLTLDRISRSFAGGQCWLIVSQHRSMFIGLYWLPG